MKQIDFIGLFEFQKSTEKKISRLLTITKVLRDGNNKVKCLNINCL